MISGQTQDINNYRPITLISCVSKLWTKIMARRVSASIEVEDIIGPEQNGFRPNRSCSDNTFVLNTILELNKSRKKLSYLLFVDLKEAYDRVDKNILFAKLRQLTSPSTSLPCLQAITSRITYQHLPQEPDQERSISREALDRVAI